MQKGEYIDIDMIKAWIMDPLKVVGVVLVEFSSMVSLLMMSKACDFLTTITSTAIILHPLDTPITDPVALVAFMNEKVMEELTQVRIVNKPSRYYW